MAEKATMNFMPTLPNRRYILAHYERIFSWFSAYFG